MNRDRLTLIATVAAACLLAVGAQSGLLAGAAGTIVGGVVGIDVPPLDDPMMIRRGAAHYDRVCARCHGSPLGRAIAEAEELSPSPPVLHRRVEDLPPEKLFDVIKHGVPGTGMPAWPVSDRDDEVWAMVSLVTRLPSLSATAYAELAGAARTDAVGLLAVCARCHGMDGKGSEDGAFPRLDIQSPPYLIESLASFRDGRRSSGFMKSAVADLRDDELKAMAEHFGLALAVEATAEPPDPPISGPSCTACHGAAVPARPEFPRLTGQHLPYLIEQFDLLADRHRPRGGGSFVELMRDAARMTDRDQALIWLTYYSLR